MKLSTIVFGAAVATLSAVPTLGAQTMYGANGCWSAPSPSLPTGSNLQNSVESNCATSDNNVQISWSSRTSSGSAWQTSSLSYQRNSAFGGPGSGDGSLSLTPWEGTVGGNQYQVFNLGTMTWVNGNTSGYGNFNSNFNLRLFLSTSTFFDYTGAVVASVDDAGSTQGVSFDWATQSGNSNGMTGFPLSDGWRYFEADGRKYQFRVLGFDTGSSQCGSYDDVSQFEQSLTASTGSSQTKNLCGKIEYVGNVSTVPEPSTYALMTAGLVGIFAVARRRRQQA